MFLTRPVRVTKVPAQLLLCGCFLLTLAGILLCLGRPNWRNAFATAVHPPSAQPLGASETKSRVMAKYSDGPIAFERNQGQTDPQVKFLARGHGYTVFLTPSETVVSLSGGSGPRRTHSFLGASANRQVESVIRMKLVGANPQPRVTGEDQLPGISNYFIGDDPVKWRTAIPQYARVGYHDVYPGVDLVFHGAQEQLEFDLLVSPGVSPDRITVKFSGASQLRADDSGGLILSSAAGDLHLHKPMAYQENNRVRKPVHAEFVIKGKNQVAFTLGAYDSTRQLVIDPTVSYATYLGGTGDDKAAAVAVDSNGMAYITGETAAAGFPNTTGSTFAGLPHDAFVTKLDPTKSGAASLVYSTFIGGNADDSGNGIAVDASGNAYIAGGTMSTNLPFTAGVFQNALKGTEDAFVAKLGSTGTITYLTYLGGDLVDLAEAIAIDSAGNAYITGQTQSSTGFPTTNGFQTAFVGAFDAFFTALNSTASSVTYSTYLGGSGTSTATAIAIDQTGKIYVTGQTDSSSPTPFPTTGGVVQTSLAGAGDAFVSKLDPTKSGTMSLIYSTYLGGAGTDSGNSIAVDSSGAAYITGSTQSTNFPTQNAFQSTLKGTQNAFVTKLNATATAPLLYSTYLGGSRSDVGFAIALDGVGNGYITGQTSSTDFPTQAPTQSALNGPEDAFVTELNSTGNSLAFSTFLGGSGVEGVGLFGGIALDSCHDIYVVGSTASTDFPVTTGTAFQTANAGGISDAFLARIGTVTNCFTLSTSSPSPNPVSKGSSATSTITLTPQTGLSPTVALTCSAPTGITCTLNPTSVTPTSPTSTLTINVSSTASLRSPKVIRGSTPFYALWVAIPGLALVGIGVGSVGSKKKSLLGVLLGCLLLAVLMLQIACGSSSSGGGGGGGGSTPYTVNVTGTGGGQTNSVAVSGSFH
jgi:Beta-propeller repeat